MNRVYTIDYLRGILAFMIMFYHYMSWQDVFIPDATSFLTRNALYGVSLFFIISGFSLTMTYYAKFSIMNFTVLKKYFIKRVARIYPLFILIVLTYLLLLYLGGKSLPSIGEIIANLTISFAVFPSYRGLTAGSWSIGIEVLFYLFFPFIIYILNKYRTIVLPLYILFIGCSLYISSYLMYDKCIEDGYWLVYMKLINHLYFFIFGVLVALLYIKYEKILNFNRTSIILSIFLIVSFFIFYPIDGSIVNLLWEENRIIFSLLIFLLFVLILMYNKYIDEKKMINKMLHYLGEISYTLYLLHPIVYLVIAHFLDISIISKTIIMVFLTLVLSVLVHFIYERKVQKIILDWSYNGK